MKVYVAGKVSKDSSFGTHYWRDEFCKELEKLSGLMLTNLDPVKSDTDQSNPSEVFAHDCFLISQADVVIVYLSDDISVGGSQEILIAKYLQKPVIGLAPRGGKFNGSTKHHTNKIIHDYKDPFVFSTCDVVCDDIESVAQTLNQLKDLKIKGIELIDEAIERISS